MTNHALYYWPMRVSSMVRDVGGSDHGLESRAYSTAHASSIAGVPSVKPVDMETVGQHICQHLPADVGRHLPWQNALMA